MKTMKNRVVLGICALILFSCQTRVSPEMQKLMAQNDSLKNVAASVQVEANDMLSILNEVESGFALIREAEGHLMVQSVTQQETTPSLREKLASDMEYVTKILKQNKEQLARLQNQLKNSRFQSAELEKRIAGLAREIEEKASLILSLQKQLADQDTRIREMGSEILSLNEDISDLEGTKAAQEQVISSQDKSIHAAWYVFGSRSALKSQNIITRQGLFGAKEILTREFNEAAFTRVDIRNLSNLPLASKRARILTSHPTASYTLSEETTGMMVLTINDPERFWSASRYLVIQTD